MKLRKNPKIALLLTFIAILFCSVIAALGYAFGGIDAEAASSLSPQTELSYDTKGKKIRLNLDSSVAAAAYPLMAPPSAEGLTCEIQGDDELLLIPDGFPAGTYSLSIMWQSFIGSASKWETLYFTITRARIDVPTISGEYSESEQTISYTLPSGVTSLSMKDGFLYSNNTITVPAGKGAGVYNDAATFTVDDNHCWDDAHTDPSVANVSTQSMSVTINRAQINVPTVSAVTYSESEQTLNLSNSSGIGSLTNNQGWTNNGTSGVQVPAKKAAGTYSNAISITPDANHYWSPDSNAPGSSQTTKQLTVTINRVKINVPTLSVITYSDVMQLVNYTLPNGVKSMTMSNGFSYSNGKINVPAKKDAGVYSNSVTFTVDDNHCWDDAHISPTTATDTTQSSSVTVNRARIAASNLPTVENGTYQSSQQNLKVTSAEMANIGTVNPPNINWTWLENTNELRAPTGAEAKKYTVSFTPDKNHCWWDSANTAPNATPVSKSVDFYINRAKLDKPTFSTTSATYSATDEIEFNISYIDGLAVTGSTFSPFTRSGQKLTAAAGTAAKVYNISISPDDNHYWGTDSNAPGSSHTAETLTFTINRAELDKPTLSTAIATYSATNAHTVTLTSTATEIGYMTVTLPTNTTKTWSQSGVTITVPAGEVANVYTLKFTLDGNHCWTDGDVAPGVTPPEHSLTFTVNRAKIDVPTIADITYSDGPQSAMVSSLNGIDEDKIVSDFTRSGVTLTIPEGQDAGKYTLKFTPDANHYWLNDSSAPGAEHTEEEVSFKINRMKIDELPTITSPDTVYSPANDFSFGISYIYGVELTYPGLMLSDTTFTVKTGTSAGDYEITVTTDKNHYWDYSKESGVAESADPELTTKVPYVLTFTVNKAKLSNAVITITTPAENIIYKAAEWKPEFTVKYEDCELASDEYEVSWENNVNASTDTKKAVLKIDSNDKNYEGENSKEFIIIKASITPDFDYGYVEFDGEFTPTVSGNTDSGKQSWTWTDGTGAAIVNADSGLLQATGAGDIKVKLTVAATDNYFGNEKELEIHINRKKVKETTVNNLPYIGRTQNVSFNDFDGKIMEATGDLTGKKISDSYTVQVTITDTNYKWESTGDGETPETLTLIWKIEQGNDDPKIDYGTVTYGKVAYPTVTEIYNPGLRTWSVTGAEGEEKVGAARINPETGMLTPLKAGKVKVTLYVEESNNYYATTKTVVVDINPAEFDLTNVRWNYTTGFTYTGKEITIKLEGLPDGLTVTYEGNSGTNAGEYTAKVASYSFDDTKYKAPDIPDCKWLIKKANPVVDVEIVNGMHFFWQNVDSVGLEGYANVEGTFSWSNPSEALTGSLGHGWTFTPDDTDNYNVLSGVLAVDDIVYWWQILLVVLALLELAMAIFALIRAIKQQIAKDEVKTITYEHPDVEIDDGFNDPVGRNQ